MSATLIRICRIAALVVAATLAATSLPGQAAATASGMGPQDSKRVAGDLARAQELLHEAERLLDKGETRLGATRAADALAIYEALPETPLTIMGRGNANYLLGRAFQGAQQDERTFEHWNATIRHYQRLTGRAVRTNLLVVLEDLIPVLERLRRNDDLLKVAAAIVDLEVELGSPAADQARSRSNFGALLMRAGRLEQAARELEQAVTLAAGGNATPLARADYLYNLGLIQARRGRAAAALENYRQALKLLEPVPESGLRRAEILLDLAGALEADGRPAEARRELEGALQLVGTDRAGQLMRAKLLLNLANDTYDRLNRPDEAMAAYREVLQLAQNQRGTEEIEAVAMLNIANHLSKGGRTDEAVRMYRDALAKQKLAGTSSSGRFTLQKNLAVTLAQAGRGDEALPYFLAATRMEWTGLAADLPALTSRGKQMAIDQRLTLLHPTYAIAFTQSKNGGIAYEAALLAKALHSEAHRLEHVFLQESASPDLVAKHGRYLELRRRISRRVLEQTDAAVAETEKLAAEASDLELQLARAPSVFDARATLRATRVEDVTARLRPGDVLLDYVSYAGRFTSGAWNEAGRHYGVFVADGVTGRVAAVHLGEQQSVNATINAFRALQSAQADPVSGRLDEAQLARAADAVRRSILDPALRGMPRPKRIYVAAEGLVGLVPFEVLPIEGAQTRYLVEDTEIVYLLTGRDLARTPSAASTASNDVWLIGDPAYDASPYQRLGISGTPVTTVSVASATGSRQTMQVVTNERRGDERDTEVPTNWLRLEGTRTIISAAAVATQKAQLIPRILVDASASEDNLPLMQRPRAVMFATHGHFMPSHPVVRLNFTSTAGQPGRINEDFFDAADPLQRSMLILAGANRRTHAVKRYSLGGQLVSAAEATKKGLSAAQMTLVERELSDGLMTAYEVRGLDLRGTEIVLLVACESGLGVPREGSEGGGLRQAQGEGVAGLRQAFAIAGAQSIVMSMWPVPLQETSMQIETFFNNWLGQRQARYQAFRGSQLAALARARQRTGTGHPFWWGGFVYAGHPGDR
jgi:CHAT domain-containing protein/tetratricopeptide (TPR) repeat protein